jgi:hypothetical protein
LEELSPGLGTTRINESEAIIRAQSMVIELMAGEVAEQVLHPDCPSLGAKHVFTEAHAIARVAVSAGSSPAAAALLSYAEAEAKALIENNLDLVHGLIEA